MSKTAFQKIIDNHLVRMLTDGRMVLKLDWVWVHEITGPNAILDMQMRGCDMVFDPNRVKTMIDHINPAKDTASAIQGKILRDWSRAHDVEFLDVGRNGVCHAVIPEKGWILPGQIGIMGDSHTCTHGAFNAFTAGVGSTELEIGIMTGLWICPPQKVIRVNVTGNLPANVFAKDIILTLINRIGVKGATNAVLEFGGAVIDGMSMEGRMTLTNMAVEAGATSGMVMADSRMLDYIFPVVVKNYKEALTSEQMLANLTRFNSDADAPYDQVIAVDVTDMAPVMTNNYSPGDVVKVADLAGKQVDQVYIGSCTNGRLEDLRIAASVFRQTRRKVSDNLRCIVVPATQYIYERAIHEGLIDTFLTAGCFVGGPSCGACLGMSCGVLAPGEVCVSTTNRNFRGRMGKDGMVHLASPATAAMTAIEGKVSEPTAEISARAIHDSSSVSASQGEAIQMTGWREKPFEKPDYGKLSCVSGKGRARNFSGKVFYLPVDNIDTDQIIPAKYLTETQKEAFRIHCLEDAPISAEDRPTLYLSKIIVAGDNFGCGSSREHAPWALEAAGIECVIATSFARIFQENMFANGLLCITLPKETIDRLFREKPLEIKIDLHENKLRWSKEAGIGFTISEFQKELIENGGSVGVMLKFAADIQETGTN